MRYLLALDLKNDPEIIAEYDRMHQAVWSEVIDSLYESGIEEMEIYRIENRLVMIIETDAHFSFDKKGRLDAENPKVQEWENMMWNYQQALPTAQEGQKWLLMTRVFEL